MKGFPTIGLGHILEYIVPFIVINDTNTLAFITE
jgi:hypothetical protein